MKSEMMNYVVLLPMALLQPWCLLFSASLCLFVLVLLRMKEDAV